MALSGNFSQQGTLSPGPIKLGTSIGSGISIINNVQSAYAYQNYPQLSSAVVIGDGASCPNTSQSTAPILNSVGSVVIGTSAVGYGGQADQVAIGPRATAYSSGSVAIGARTSAGGSSTAIGMYASAPGSNSVAIGVKAFADGGNSIAISSIGFNTANMANANFAYMIGSGMNGQKLSCHIGTSYWGSFAGQAITNPATFCFSGPYKGSSGGAGFTAFSVTLLRAITVANTATELTCATIDNSTTNSTDYFIMDAGNTNRGISGEAFINCYDSTLTSTQPLSCFKINFVCWKGATNSTMTIVTKSITTLSQTSVPVTVDLVADTTNGRPSFRVTSANVQWVNGYVTYQNLGG